MKALCCFCVCFLLLLEVCSGSGDLRRPENVSVDSLNTRYVLRWDWPHETTANQTVTFTAQYLWEFRSRKLSNDKNWRLGCESVSELRCDFTGAELHYKCEYLFRVRSNISQKPSGWVQIRFCPDKHAALGPPSSVELNSVKGDLEVFISDPLSSTNQSMKTLLEELRYLIQYWRRSEDPQNAKVLETENNLVVLSDLDRQTWYCVRVQSRSMRDDYNKSSIFSDTLCTRTEGRMPYWLIPLCFLLLCFQLGLLYFCFHKTFTLLKNTFCPAIQLPDNIKEWLSDSEKPQLLAPESPESACELLVTATAELDERSSAEEQDSSTHSRHGSGDSGVYSTEEDSTHLQMSSRKHREELHDGTLLELCA